MKKTIPWFVIAVVVIVIDQITKVWAETELNDGSVIVVTSFFKFQLAYNTGAAFSFLGDAGGWQRWLFSIIAIVFSAGIVVWIKKLVASGKTDRFYELLGFSLILGGAIGNLYDRIVLGHVIDFIVWHYERHYWPTFNIADSAICAGAALLVIDMLFIQDNNSDEQDKSSS